MIKRTPEEIESGMARISRILWGQVVFSLFIAGLFYFEIISTRINKLAAIVFMGVAVILAVLIPFILKKVRSKIDDFQG